MAGYGPPSEPFGAPGYSAASPPQWVPLPGTAWPQGAIPAQLLPPRTGRRRHPLGVLGLAFVTLGIYGYVWYYKSNEEASFLSGKTLPVPLVLALHIGFLVVGVIVNGLGSMVIFEKAEGPLLLIAFLLLFASNLIFLYGAYRMADNVDAAHEVRGIAGLGVVPTFILLIPLVNLVGMPIVQHQMNKLWAR